jgi:hypothetical protein
MAVNADSLLNASNTSQIRQCNIELREPETGLVSHGRLIARMAVHLPHAIDFADEFFGIVLGRIWYSPANFIVCVMQSKGSNCVNVGREKGSTREDNFHLLPSVGGDAFECAPRLPL